MPVDRPSTKRAFCVTVTRSPLPSYSLKTLLMNVIASPCQVFTDVECVQSGHPLHTCAKNWLSAHMANEPGGPKKFECL